MCTFRVDWIEWQGKKYCLDDVVFCGFKDERPQFGKINEIIMIISHVFLVLSIYITNGIDRHYNSILIEKSPNLDLKHLTEDSAFSMFKQHTFETHLLHSCKPGEYHIVSKYFLSNLN